MGGIHNLYSITSWLGDWHGKGTKSTHWGIVHYHYISSYIFLKHSIDVWVCRIMVGDIVYLKLSIACRTWLTGDRFGLCQVKADLALEDKVHSCTLTSVLVIDGDITRCRRCIHTIDISFPYTWACLGELYWLLWPFSSSCWLEGIVVLSLTYLAEGYFHCIFCTYHTWVLYLCFGSHWSKIFLHCYRLRDMTVISISYMYIPSGSRWSTLDLTTKSCLKSLIQEHITAIG